MGGVAGSAGVANAQAGATGSGSGGSAAGAGGSSSGPTRTEACIEYVLAQCERKLSCLNVVGTQDCVVESLRCPDLLFSEGSSLTVDEVLACADAWPAVSCDDVLHGRKPCPRPGSRTVGEECAFGSQCASYFCPVDDSSECHRCGEVVEGDPPVPFAQKAANETCITPWECMAGLLCMEGIMDARRCAALPGEGEACLSGACATEHYCDGASSMCIALPRAGEACALDGLLAVRPCEAGASCQCRDAAAPVPCGDRVCLRIGLPGEPCGTPEMRCHPGTECVDGACQPIESQGTFLELCGG